MLTVTSSYKMFILYLQIVEGAAYVNKGCHSEVDSYSAFWDNNKLSQTDLVRILAKHKVTDVYVCGVAYDVCVGWYSSHIYFPHITASSIQYYIKLLLC